MCHQFTYTSPLSGTLEVIGHTSQLYVLLQNPDLEEIRIIPNFEGDKVYVDGSPQVGSWKACVETGTLTVSVDIEERISSTLQFVTESGGSVAVSESPVPPACK